MIKLDHVRTPSGPLILRVVRAGTRPGDLMIHNPRRQWRYFAARVQRRGQWSVLLLHPNDDPFGPVAYEFTVEDRSQVAAAVEKVKQEAAQGMIP